MKVVEIRAARNESPSLLIGGEGERRSIVGSFWQRSGKFTASRIKS
jgi:hypothetical protein